MDITSDDKMDQIPGAQWIPATELSHYLWIRRLQNIHTYLTRDCWRIEISLVQVQLQ